MALIGNPLLASDKRTNPTKLTNHSILTEKGKKNGESCASVLLSVCLVCVLSVCLRVGWLSETRIRVGVNVVDVGLVVVVGISTAVRVNQSCGV